MPIEQLFPRARMRCRLERDPLALGNKFIKT
jgi:hypothetical protein